MLPLQIDVAAAVIKSSFLRKFIDLDEADAAVIKTSLWKEQKAAFLTNYTTLDIAESDTQLTLILTSDIVVAVLEHVQNFLREHAIRQEFVPVASMGVLTLVDRYLRDELRKICDAFSSCCVSIESNVGVVETSALGFVVSGTVHGLKNAVDQLKKLTKKVVEEDKRIERPGIPQFLRESKGRKKIDQWNQQHRVFIEEITEGLSVRSGSTGWDHGTVAEVTVGSKFLVKIMIGDLTKHTVDVIVNAANVDMIHAGGLAGNIVTAGLLQMVDVGAG